MKFTNLHLTVTDWVQRTLQLIENYGYTLYIGILFGYAKPVQKEDKERMTMANGKETDIQMTDLTAAGSGTSPAAIQTDDKTTVTENVLRRHIKEDPRKRLLAKHRLWMDSLQHEYPLPFHPFKIGVYIRYYNQTKYKNYIEKHLAQFRDDIALCPAWTLVDFYLPSFPFNSMRILLMGNVWLS